MNIFNRKIILFLVGCVIACNLNAAGRGIKRGFLLAGEAHEDGAPMPKNFRVAAHGVKRALERPEDFVPNAKRPKVHAGDEMKDEGQDDQKDQGLANDSDQENQMPAHVPTPFGTLLHRSALCDDYKEVVNLVCSGGWPVDLLDEPGRTPADVAPDGSESQLFLSQCLELLDAVQARDLAKVRDLVFSPGVERFLKARNYHGKTALHLAVESNDDQIVNLLMSRFQQFNIDVNSKDNDFSEQNQSGVCYATPLQRALLLGLPQMVTLLLDCNVIDFSQLDDEGRNLFELARATKDARIIKSIWLGMQSAGLLG